MLFEGVASPQRQTQPSRIAPVTGFHPKCLSKHIQRRYRLGFSPNYLVQQIRPYAASATKGVSSCPKYCSTSQFPCQSGFLPRKNPPPLAVGFPLLEIKRREVEKRIFVRKEAAHGFRNLSAIKIHPGFEQVVTQIKTNHDFFVNKPVYFSLTRSCQKATALAAATFSESTPWDMGISTV